MKLNIPEYIKLEQRQIDKAQAWFDRRNRIIEAHSKLKATAEAWSEEDCSPISTITWKIRGGGICTQILLEDAITGNVCDLTIDDDNELSPLL